MTGKLDPTIQAAVPSILDKVMPEGFVQLEMRPGTGSDTHQQGCQVYMDPDVGKKWKGYVHDSWRYAKYEDVGSRHKSDTITLVAERDNAHWFVTESDVDPENMDAAELESRVRECITALARSAGVSYDGGVTRAGIIQHNLQSWTATIAAGQP
ncbi:hypothetical protein AB4Y45_33660 [Paraburkholderia sp. EG287A]|uniref:hypothetical protein n=1 Tax=Paraburkholderia sp. EG287A TaxID=3237012 RepID=UPI0034D24C3A